MDLAVNEACIFDWIWNGDRKESCQQVEFDSHRSKQ